MRLLKWIICFVVASLATFKEELQLAFTALGQPGTKQGGGGQVVPNFVQVAIQNYQDCVLGAKSHFLDLVSKVVHKLAGIDDDLAEASESCRRVPKTNFMEENQMQIQQIMSL